MIEERPRPLISSFTAPFWSAARERRLEVQRCDDCATYRFPPDPGCFACGSAQYSWIPVSGDATLWSWTVCYPPMLPFFQARAPWPVAVVQLAEGPRMVAAIEGISPDEYQTGMPLRAAFSKVDEDLTLVVFEKA
ncbi:MAG: Zn-ribbon domain-containing OB-fold protein [Dehalococcoidia bacterium]